MFDEIKNKDAGILKGSIGDSKVTVSINRVGHNETAVTISARKWLIPDRQTASGVLYKISMDLK